MAYVVSGLVENKRKEDIERFGGPQMQAALAVGAPGFGSFGGPGGAAGEDDGVRFEPRRRAPP